MAPPTLDLERARPGPACGVDEAGRGCWAGPVVAAAVVLDPARVPAGIDDSKKLSAARRRRLDALIRATAAVGVGCAGVAEVERLNVLHAAMLAMRRAVRALAVAPAHALIDGDRLPDLRCPATAVVGGDRRSLSIAAASIVAKTTRDRLMSRLARRYPRYGWERNAGYGTAEHRAALECWGATPHHRRGFRPVAAVIARAAASRRDRP